MSINVEISVGELLDKITILEIKAERINDANKLGSVNKELMALKSRWQQQAYSDKNLVDDIAALKETNDELWQIEDAIREKEKQQVFDKEFIELARSIYLLNDKRAKIKRVINIKTGSTFVEEKSYGKYKSA